VEGQTPILLAAAETGERKTGSLVSSAVAIGAGLFPLVPGTVGLLKDR
jgi:hypothetical protein